MSIFESKGSMPADPSKDVVRSALAEPQDKHYKQVPGSYQYDHHIEHAPVPKIGKDCC